MRKFLASFLIPAFALTLGACGDEPTGPDISQQQAEEVAAAVTSAVSQTFSLSLSGAGAASLAPGALTPGSTETARTADTDSYSFDTSASCPQGGTMSTRGSGTITHNETQSTITHEFDWSAQASYTNCGVDTDQGNRFTLSTSSPIQFTGNGSITSEKAVATGSGSVGTTQLGGTSGTFNWDYSGTFDWNEQGGPSANCDVDLTTNLEFQSSDGVTSTNPDVPIGQTARGGWTGSIEGTVCGREVSRSVETTLALF